MPEGGVKIAAAIIKAAQPEVQRGALPVIQAGATGGQNPLQQGDGFVATLQRPAQRREDHGHIGAYITGVEIRLYQVKGLLYLALAFINVGHTQHRLAALGDQSPTPA